MSYENEINEDGYKYSFETSDGTKAQQEGESFIAFIVLENSTVFATRSNWLTLGTAAAYTEPRHKLVHPFRWPLCSDNCSLQDLCDVTHNVVRMAEF